MYGLTSASFDHPFRDNRNKDNIVAKRGALFMVNLKHEVQRRGFIVAHIKTDSIKIPDATPEIIRFVMDYGKQYGYNFEHEATYDRMCLVNDAVYIAKYKDGKHAGEWTATGTQFQVPYVFKKLFSKEPIEFEDMCETKSVTSALYLDMNENLPDVSEAEKIKALRRMPSNQISKAEYNRLNGKSSYGFKWLDVSNEELNDMIASGHNYHSLVKSVSSALSNPDAEAVSCFVKQRIRKPEKKDMRPRQAQKVSDGWSLRWFGNSARKMTSIALTTTIL